jgi:hypothetical protein
MNNTITLKDFHSEGSGDTMSVDFIYLKENTLEWLDAKSDDFWESEEELHEAKNNIIPWVIECYEYEQGWSSVDGITLEDFCKREIKIVS